jgi:hypothetical protein
VIPKGTRGQGFKDSPMAGSSFHYDNRNAKELQRAEGYSRKTTLDYVRMLYISYGSVCELETQILLVGGLNLIEKSELVH